MEDTKPADTIESPEDKDTEEIPEDKEEVDTDVDEKEDEDKDFEPEVRTTKKEDKTEEKEDDDLDQEDAVRIDKRVAKEVDPLKKIVSEQSDKIEVDGFIRENPGFSKYRDKMLKYISNDSYNNISIHNIAKIAAGNDMQKIGAAKEREASKKASDSKTVGNTSRDLEKGGVDWSKASKEEHTQKYEEVMGYN